jgi:hypothetical protein
MNIKHLARLVILTVICVTVLIRCIDYDFSLSLTPYSGTLKTDGYYYQHDDYGHTPTMYLYQNGIILRGYGYQTFNLDSVEYQMVKSYNSFTKSRTAFGIFMVTRNEIVYEKRTSQGVYKCFGVVENDTTFQITHCAGQGNKHIHENDVWHFKQFSPKPDSTNRWIQ